MVGVIMGSKSDYEVMQDAISILEEFGIKYEVKVVSAHRTPELLYQYAHLPGMVAASCELPVIGVPVKSKALNGLDSLLSIVQMPAGVPVGTMAINGAKNAALYCASILALHDEEIRKKYLAFRQKQTKDVLEIEL